MAMTKAAKRARAKKAWETRKANEAKKANPAFASKLTLKDYSKLKPVPDPTISSLCGQLEDAIANLEIRVSNLTTRINSLL